MSRKHLYFILLVLIELVKTKPTCSCVQKSDLLGSYWLYIWVSVTSLFSSVLSLFSITPSIDVQTVFYSYNSSSLKSTQCNINTSTSSISFEHFYALLSSSVSYEEQLGFVLFLVKERGKEGG